MSKTMTTNEAWLTLIKLEMNISKRADGIVQKQERKTEDNCLAIILPTLSDDEKKILMQRLEREDELAPKLKFDEKYYLYLDELRESGETNMYGATPYLQRRFSIERQEAKDILKDWMDTFGQRHKGE